MSLAGLQRHVDMLPSADGQRQPMMDIGSNLHIARSPEGTIQVILDNADAPTEQVEPQTQPSPAAWNSTAVKEGA